MELFLLTRNEQQVVLSNVRRRLTALNVLAVTREHLGALDRVTRIVRLSVAGRHVCEIMRKSQTTRPNCFRVFSADGRIPVGWCMASPVFRSAPRRAGTDFRSREVGTLYDASKYRSAIRQGLLQFPPINN
jgi:hypothetical protein